jgi:hypothetical protein
MDLESPFAYLFVKNSYEINNLPLHLLSDSRAFRGISSDMSQLPEHGGKILTPITHILDYIQTCKDCHYDLISLGNITDHLGPKEILLFLKHIHRISAKGARLVFRRINSDYNLRPLINNRFVVLEIDRNLNDKTYLYREVVIATPR